MRFDKTKFFKLDGKVKTSYDAHVKAIEKSEHNARYHRLCASVLKRTRKSLTREEKKDIYKVTKDPNKRYF